MYKIINKKKRVATIILDSLGKVLFALPRFFRKSEAIDQESIRSILIIRTAYIGDVVMTLPLVQVLHKRYPRAKITFLTSRAATGLLTDHPAITEVLPFDPFWFYPTGVAAWFRFIKRLRCLHFDLLIEARADIRELTLLAFFCRARYKISYAIGGGSYLLSHIVPYPGVTHKVVFHLQLAAYLGCRVENTEGGLYLSDTVQQQAQKILDSQGIADGFIAVHPGSRLELKRWPLERCARLYDTLIATYKLPVILFGSSQETDLARTILDLMVQRPVSLVGLIDLPVMAAILSRAGIFICNDSAPMHIAAALNTATVAIFGPSKSVETGPYCTKSQVIEKDMHCRADCDESHCRISEYHACMKRISIEDVLAGVAHFLNCRSIITQDSLHDDRANEA